ncbi:MAG: alpha/beta hydrolase [Candidatus Hydrogenedentes bacterium]|nr:alpha/beta hydrolase [Candidatus Hydrogenedentota bacterium]
MTGTRKQKLLIGVVLVLVVAALGCYAAIMAFPELGLALVRMQYERASGVTAKSAVVDGYTIPYYEGGSGEPLVMIHGFGDSRISFVQCAKWLTPKYRVILPDVPGFGDTAQDEKLDYGAHAQSERMHKFLHQIGVDKFHLAGNSMGGHIAASYALKYPEDVLSLILIDAAGVKVKEGMPYADADKPAGTPEEFDAYMDKVFVQKPPIPDSFKRYFIKQAQKNFAWQNRIRADLRKSPDAIFNDRLSNIKAPTLVLWGDRDQLIELAVGEAYHAGIAGSKFVVFKDCGHSPQYERPKETADAIVAFLSEIPK